jgi:ABC-type phosphate transport system substrate-binding protein
MDDILKVVDVIGVIIPIIAFVWQFAIIGRKRIGYRAQLDTPISEQFDENKELPRHLGVLKNLRPQPDHQGEHAEPLGELSIVLLRVENDGVTSIGSDDYYDNPADGNVGLHVRFPGRRVIGMAVTDFSPPGLQHSLGEGSGLDTRQLSEQGGTIGIIDLPKVKLNRGNHYKVLVVLARADPGNWVYQRLAMPQSWWRERLPLPERAQEQTARRGLYYPPEINDALFGGTVHETRSRTGPSRASLALIAFLVLLMTGQFVVELNRHPTRLDCETGHLKVVGSTAFGPVASDAAASYMKLCPGSSITTDFASTEQGLQAIDQEGERNGEQPVSDAVALADGDQLARGFPELVARPISLGLFAVVVNNDTGVANLDTDQIQGLFTGKITNWNQIGGHNVPVRLVGRNSDSGSRATFEQRFLPAIGEPQDNSHDCVNPERPAETGTTLCLRASSQDLLDEVATVNGAVGYAELGLALARGGVTAVSIDSFPASTDIAVHQGYPFWQTEFAYTYKDPTADSLAAGFLRFLTDQMGADIVRSHHDLPCSALPNPALCRPEA